MRLKTIILDDEPLAVELLEEYCGHDEVLEHVASFTEPLDALRYLKQQTVDLVFLDIQMPGLNGLELSRILPSSCNIVFTTAHREFALDAFDLNATDYLLKPISLARFLMATEKVRKQKMFLVKNPEHVIVIRANRKDHYLKPMDILYVEALKDYVKVHTVNGVLVSRGTLRLFLKKPELSFIQRVHRSYAINPAHVTARSAEGLFMNEQFIPIGDAFKEN